MHLVKICTEVEPVARFLSEMKYPSFCFKYFSIVITKSYHRWVSKNQLDFWFVEYQWVSECLSESQWVSLSLIESHWVSLSLIESHWVSLSLIESLSLLESRWVSASLNDFREWWNRKILLHRYWQYCNEHSQKLYTNDKLHIKGVQLFYGPQGSVDGPHGLLTDPYFSW